MIRINNCINQANRRFFFRIYPFKGHHVFSLANWYFQNKLTGQAEDEATGKLTFSTFLP